MLLIIILVLVPAWQTILPRNRLVRVLILTRSNGDFEPLGFRYFCGLKCMIPILQMVRKGHREGVD